MNKERLPISRRDFIGQSVRGAGALAVGAALQNKLQAGEGKNPFAYDIDALAKTNPALIKYEEVGRFTLSEAEPRRIALGPEEKIYIAVKNGLAVLDRSGQALSQIPLSGPARCLAVAGDGSVYAGLRDHIEVFDGKGVQQASWAPPGKRTWLTGLAVGDTDVFAADSGNRVILRYDRAGKLQGRIGEKNKDRNVPGLIVPSPYLAVALARDGLLRVNDPGRHRVEAYTLDGDLEFFWGKPSGAIEGFCGCCNPIGISLLPDGKCVTCEKGLPRVKVYGTDGSFESVVAGPEAFPENARSGSVHDLSDGTMGGLDAAVDSQQRVYVLDIVARDVRVMQRKA